MLGLQVLGAMFLAFRLSCCSCADFQYIWIQIFGFRFRIYMFFWGGSWVFKMQGLGFKFQVLCFMLWGFRCLIFGIFGFQAFFCRLWAFRLQISRFYVLVCMRHAFRSQPLSSQVLGLGFTLEGFRSQFSKCQHRRL